MRRREFITLLGGAAAWPLAARAQQVGKVPRIGYLSPGSATPGPLAYHDEFRRGLRELGYVEGRNIVIEYRFPDGNFDRLAQLAAELVQLNVDVIVSVVTQASLAAKNATSTIPIVIVSVLYSAAFHLLLGRVYDDKDVQERIVRGSKLDWVIVRPVILTNGPKTNAYRALVDPRGWTCGFISRADVADFLVKQIDDDAFLHKTPVLTS
jgi:putative ABC transport system substrate-binding protein